MPNYDLSRLLANIPVSDEIKPRNDKPDNLPLLYISSRPYPPELEEEILDFHCTIDKSGNCWEWMGDQNSSGYGIFYARTVAGGVAKASAHRYSAILEFGIPPDEWHIHHTCRRRICVRPDHLQYMPPYDHNRLTTAQYLLDLLLPTLSDEDIAVALRRAGRTIPL